MNGAGLPRQRPVVRHPVALWSAFIVVHATLAAVGLVLARNATFSDVSLYRTWATDGLRLGSWPVLDFDWVYPFGALAPMLAAAPWGATDVGYILAWTTLVTVANAVAVAVLLRTSSRGEFAAWWLLGAILALGPIMLGRLDGLVTPLTVSALAIAATRPRLASAVLATGAWIKVAPGAVVLALATTARRAWRDILLPAALVSGGIIVIALTLGAGRNVLGFLVEQGSRGLQVESVAATWFSAWRLTNSAIVAMYNADLNTFEISGVETGALTRSLDGALVLAVALIGFLSWRAARAAPAEPGGAILSPDVLLLASLALETALIVFNKVGSPQFIAWLIAPVAVGLSRFGWSGGWRTAGTAVLGIAFLTQMIYPWAYGPFLAGWPPIVVVAAGRNVLLVALLGWAVARLWRTGSRSRT